MHVLASFEVLLSGMKAVTLCDVVGQNKDQQTDS